MNATIPVLKNYFPENNRIDKELINDLPVLHFPGEIRIVNTTEGAVAAVEQLLAEPAVGFDTESRPSFKKGVSYPISVVQVSTRKEAFIFQIGPMGFLEPLLALMADPHILKVGVGLKSDIPKIRELAEIQPAGFVDLSQIAESKGIVQVGARALVARYMGKRLSKAARITNWAIDELTRKQLMYAAADAWICLEIYPELLRDLTDYRLLSRSEDERVTSEAQAGDSH